MNNIDRPLASLIMSIPVGELYHLFKRREIVTEKVDVPFIVRLDGVRFGKKLKECDRPRDRKVHDALLRAAEEIMSYMGAEVGYVTSDEINIIFLRYAPYNARYFKIISITSGIASAIMSRLLEKDLFFDSRIVKVYDIYEIYKYILYRVRVGFNNCISLIYHSIGDIGRRHTPHIHDMICIANKIKKFENWELFGTLIYREEYVKISRDPVKGSNVAVRRKRLSRKEITVELVQQLRSILMSLSGSKDDDNII